MIDRVRPFTHELPSYNMVPVPPVPRSEWQTVNPYTPWLEQINTWPFAGLYMRGGAFQNPADKTQPDYNITRKYDKI